MSEQAVDKEWEIMIDFTKFPEYPNGILAKELLELLVKIT